MGCVIVWDIKTVPTSRASHLPMIMPARAMTKFALAARPHFHRYTKDAVDLCDVLSSFSPHNKATLHELCRVMGLPGKPDGMSGGEVEKYYHDGLIREIGEYCKSVFVNTYRVWLRHELFHARLTEAEFQSSEVGLFDFIKVRGDV